MSVSTQTRTWLFVQHWVNCGSLLKMRRWRFEFLKIWRSAFLSSVIAVQMNTITADCSRLNVCLFICNLLFPPASSPFRPDRSVLNGFYWGAFFLRKWLNKLILPITHTERGIKARVGLCEKHCSACRADLFIVGTLREGLSIVIHFEDDIIIICLPCSKQMMSTVQKDRTTNRERDGDNPES